MPKKRNGVSRREFIRDAALLSGGLAAVGLPGTARAQGQPPKIGAQLIGKLEGPELILDPAKWPTKFSEAPMLAELVKQGKLPPVAERVPKEPLVIKPVHSIGRYGGTWRRGFTGPGDQRERQPHRARPTSSCSGSTRAPSTGPASRASGSWPTTENPSRSTSARATSGRTGSPSPPTTSCSGTRTSTSTRTSRRSPHPDFMINGKSGVVKKIDETTVLFEFPEPNYLFLDILAGSTAMGGGQALWQMAGPRDGRLHAGPLRQAVPPEVHRGGRREREGEGRELRRLARVHQELAGTGRSTPSCPC